MPPNLHQAQKLITQSRIWFDFCSISWKFDTLSVLKLHFSMWSLHFCYRDDKNYQLQEKYLLQNESHRALWGTRWPPQRPQHSLRGRCRPPRPLPWPSWFWAWPPWPSPSPVIIISDHYHHHHHYRHLAALPGPGEHRAGVPAHLALQADVLALPGRHVHRARQEVRLDWKQRRLVIRMIR